MRSHDIYIDSVPRTCACTHMYICIKSPLNGKPFAVPVKCNLLNFVALVKVFTIFSYFSILLFFILFVNANGYHTMTRENWIRCREKMKILQSFKFAKRELKYFKKENEMETINRKDKWTMSLWRANLVFFFSFSLFWISILWWSHSSLLIHRCQYCTHINHVTYVTVQRTKCGPNIQMYKISK